MRRRWPPHSRSPLCMGAFDTDRFEVGQDCLFTEAEFSAKMLTSSFLFAVLASMLPTLLEVDQCGLITKVAFTSLMLSP